jgi:Rad3-related DNA helicase
MEQAAGDPLVGPREQKELAVVTAWSRETVLGDIAEVSEVSEESPLWPYVTSTVENCLGQKCPRIDDCHVKEARRRAVAADLVVVNHHLLFADMALRDAGFGEILPTAQCVVIDEAHQLPELAANAFGHALSARQLRELSRDSDRAARSEAPDMPDLREAARLLEQGVEQAIGALAQFSGKQSESLLTAHPLLGELLETLHGHLTSLGTQLELAAGRGEELEACERDPTRAFEILMNASMGNPGVIQSAMARIGKKLQQKVASGELKPQELVAEAEDMIKEFQSHPAFVDLMETFRTAFNVNPVDVARAQGTSVRLAEVRERLKKKAEMKEKEKNPSATSNKGVPTNNSVTETDEYASIRPPTRKKK